ncbi:thioredoxin [Paraburkholderia sp. CNPSo 3157]|uniref:Thioredoxin n=1 Tax=Paraburkholderia franconis TaxID=2654983 RepID=A0A7X1TDZ6_9BURK|nr:thioredoxin family protein [Paraburkholderia franconis]MPW15810.1 thioredoxin [Paraburkholderia franconis]
MAGIPVDSAAFAAFDMQELTAETFDAGLQSAGEELAVVFFWGLDCYNCEIAKKAMLAQPDAIRALGLRWFHSNVYEHRDLGRRFMLHGVPTWFFFHRGKRLGRATGWHGLAQFEAAVGAAREKMRTAGLGAAGLGAAGADTARPGAAAAAGPCSSGPGAAGGTVEPASDNGRTD